MIAIIQVLEHPTAPMIRRFQEYTDLLSFDIRNDWHKWQQVYGFAKIAGSKRAYLTYGGGPEGGIVRLQVSAVEGKVWYIWHRGWGEPVSLLRIPPELSVVYRNDDGYEAVKLVMDDYELAEEYEWFLDDLEDNNEEHDESEYGMMNDEDDEANEGREDDSETEAEDEMEDEADDVQAMINNERREEIEQLNHERRQEIASLTRELEDNNVLADQQSALNGVNAVNYVIHVSQLRIAELKNEIALSRR